MEHSTLDITEYHDMELHQMQLFVQSEAESRNFGEVSRVLHQAVKCTQEHINQSKTDRDMVENAKYC